MMNLIKRMGYSLIFIILFIALVPFLMVASVVAFCFASKIKRDSEKSDKRDSLVKTFKNK